MTSESVPGPKVEGNPAPSRKDAFEELAGLAPELAQLPEPTADRVIGIVARIVRERQTLPFPHELEAYDKILPGAAERILCQVEREQSHRLWWERYALKAQFALALFGLVAGFLVSLALIGCAVYIGLQGQSWLASAFLGTAAVGMVGTFVRGRSLFAQGRGEDAEATDPN